MSTNTALDQIKNRVEAATPGPWVEFHENGTPGVTEAFHCAPATGAFLINYGADHDQQGRDATFIAHARTDIPKLLAALEAVEARIAEHESRTPWPDATEVDKAYSLGKEHAYRAIRAEIEEALR